MSLSTLAGKIASQLTQAALGEGDYYFDGNISLPARVGNYTSSTTLSDSTEGDGTTGPLFGATLATLIRVEAIRAAPAQISLMLEYTGTMTMTVFGSNDAGDTWTELTDISGVAWPVNAVSTPTAKVLYFADGATTYNVLRVNASVTVDLAQVTDFRVFNTFVPSLTANLDEHWTAVRDTYSDTACTALVTADGAAVGGWNGLSATHWKAIQATGANQPTIERNVSGYGTHALQFSDNPTTPAAYYWLDVTNYLTSRFNTSHTVYIVANRPAAQTNNGYLFTRVNNPAWGLNSTGAVFAVGTQFAYGASCSNPSAYNGIFGCGYDGVMGVGFHDDQEVGDKSTASLGFGTNSMRLGNYDGTSTFSWKGYIFEVLVYTATHTEAQRRTIVAELQAFYGQVTVESWLVEGNSISAGFLTYNDPWPNYLNTYLAPDVGKTVRATAGHTTQQRATDTIANAITYGNHYGFDAVTSTGTPTQTTIQATGSPGWTTDQWAGYYCVMNSGSDGVRGMAGVVASNTSDTITLVTSSVFVGFPTAPTSGNTFRLFPAGNQRSSLICIPWELTNDLSNNGATVGPAAVSNVKTACTPYQNFAAWCLACKAFGFKVVACTILDRNTTPYANFQADILVINDWIRADYLLYADGLYDSYIDSRSATCDYPAPATYFIDESHPSNTLSPILAEDIAAVGTAL